MLSLLDFRPRLLFGKQGGIKLSNFAFYRHGSKLLTLSHRMWASVFHFLLHRFCGETRFIFRLTCRALLGARSTPL